MGAGIAFYFGLPFEPGLWALAATPVFARHGSCGGNCLARWSPLSHCWSFALGFQRGADRNAACRQRRCLTAKQAPLPVTGRLMLTEVMPEGVRLTLKDLEIGHMDRRSARR